MRSRNDYLRFYTLWGTDPAATVHARCAKRIATRTVGTNDLVLSCNGSIETFSRQGTYRESAGRVNCLSLRCRQRRTRERGGEPDTYQPPPPVKKRRMKRSCSVRMWLVLYPSIESSNASLIEVDCKRILSVVPAECQRKSSTGEADSAVILLGTKES